MTKVSIQEHVARLSRQEQASLAQWILLHIEESSDDEADVDDAWRKEINKRVAELEKGVVPSIPSKKVWADLMTKYGKEN